VDLESPELPDSFFTWWVDFHHEDHTHPSLGPKPGRSLSFVIPQIGETSTEVWYRLYLNVRDSEGLDNTTFAEAYPLITQMTVQTDPTGMSIKLDQIEANSPYDFESVSGVRRNISVPGLQYKDGELYRFVKWSDSHLDPVLKVITPPIDSTIVAKFQLLSRIKLYPNPASTKLNIEISTAFDENVELLISNSNGQVIISRKIDLVTNQSSLLEFPIETLPAGLYNVSLASQFGTYTQSFIKQ